MIEMSREEWEHPFLGFVSCLHEKSGRHRNLEWDLPNTVWCRMQSDLFSVTSLHRQMCPNIHETSAIQGTIGTPFGTTASPRIPILPNAEYALAVPQEYYSYWDSYRRTVFHDNKASLYFFFVRGNGSQIRPKPRPTYVAPLDITRPAWYMLRPGYVTSCLLAADLEHLARSTNQKLCLPCPSQQRVRGALENFFTDTSLLPRGLDRVIMATCMSFLLYDLKIKNFPSYHAT